MSDWRDRAVPVDSTISASNWRSRAITAGIQPSQPDAPEDEGAVDAAEKGLVSGATMGFAPQILGGAAALPALFDHRSFLDEYAKRRDAEKAIYAAAQANHPAAYGAGNLAGNAATLLGTGGLGLASEAAEGAGLTARIAQGAKEAAQIGGVTGALEGASGSNATDLKGQALDAIKGGTAGVGAGVLTGGAAGAVGPALGEYAGNILNGLKGTSEDISNSNLLGKPLGAFSQGLKGNKVFGPRAIGSAESDISGALNQASAAKNAILNNTSGTVDITGHLNDLGQAIGDMKQEARHAPTSADLDTLRDTVMKYVGGDPESGFNFLGTDLTPKQVEELRLRVNTLAQNPDQVNGALQTSGARDVAKAFANKLQDLQETSVPQLAPENFTINKLLNLKDDSLPLPGSSGEQAINNKIANNPDLGPRWDQIQDLRSRYDIANKISKTNGVFAPGVVTRSPTGDVAAGANAVGLAVKAVTPDWLRATATHVADVGGEVGSQLANILNQAAERDHLGRNALMFSVQQNPAYRKLLTDHMDSQKEQ